MKFFPYTILILSVLVLCRNAAADEAQDLYMEAKMMCVDQQWKEAINTFEQVIEKYPDSQYIDDAHFWIGYCLEKIPQRQIDAFMRFDKVVNKFPQSSWADDAVIHQISIAELFVGEGQNQYKQFLSEQLNSNNSEIKNRAALALGRLGDKQALPVLKSLSKDKDFGELASDLATTLEGKDVDSKKRNETDIPQKPIPFLYDFQKRQAIKQQQEEEDDFFSFFNTQRYEQYKSMLRKDNNWSKQELNDFALWHIIDSDKFEEYRSLSNEYDKKEWKRKYWKSLDPTPTTEKNELLETFNERIIYSVAHFSRCWNYNHFKYLPDQHLRDGWDHAPWDARGELYIKYGEPDVRSVEGWHTEEWIYYRYGVDFIVKQYMTNIYGNAISGGAISRSRYGDNFSRGFDSWQPYLDANFIYNNEIKYEHDYKAEPIEDLEMSITQEEVNGKNQIIISYSLDGSELNLSEDNYTFTEKYIVFNSDLREVLKNETKRKITYSKDSEDEIVQKLSFSLPRGEYLIAMKIQDASSNKLGIYKQNFTVE